jgi:hypothetical protein
MQMLSVNENAQIDLQNGVQVQRLRQEHESEEMLPILRL